MSANQQASSQNDRQQPFISRCVSCDCPYLILGIARSELLTTNEARRYLVENKANFARNSINYLPSSIDNMRLKERGYKLIEISKLLLVDQRMEGRFGPKMFAIASNEYSHVCSRWLETIEFISSARSIFANRSVQQQVQVNLEPDSTT